MDDNQKAAVQQALSAIIAKMRSRREHYQKKADAARERAFSPDATREDHDERWARFERFEMAAEAMEYAMAEAIAAAEAEMAR